MEYTIEMCSLYDKKTINNTLIVIFQDHNMALPIWGTFANKIKQSLKLISFDFHSDTRDPFATKVGPHDFEYKQFEKNILSKINYGIDNFSFEDVYKLSCDYVVNDEHILTAYLFEYINSYHIFCDLPDDELVCYQRDDRRRGLAAFYNTKSSIRNLSNEQIEELCDAPFILDFDLDYFTTPKLFDKVFKDKLSLLVQKATVITIAREPEYFEKEKYDESFTNDDALFLLLNMIEEILCNKLQR